MKRRSLLTWLASLFLLPDYLYASKANKSKPKVGDTLVYAFGETKGQVVIPDDVQDEMIYAFARDAGGLVRDGSLHNQVSLLRLEFDSMSEKTRKYSAKNLVAVSSACTHTGCEVSGWKADRGELVCPCHGSRFAVPDAAKVINGPATKPLAFLPIEIVDNEIRVRGKFSRRVGPAPTF